MTREYVDDDAIAIASIIYISINYKYVFVYGVYILIGTST